MEMKGVDLPVKNIPERLIGPEEVHRRVRELGLRTGAEAVEMLREDRDAH